MEMLLVNLVLILLFSAVMKMAHDIRCIKGEIAKFLRPRLVFFIGNELIRRLQMKDNQKVTLSLTQVDAKSQPIANPEPYDTPPAYSIDNGQIASLSPSADGTTCDVTAGLPGSASVTVSASIGGKAFTGTYAVVVTPGDAASISIQASAPVAQ